MEHLRSCEHGSGVVRFITGAGCGSAPVLHVPSDDLQPLRSRSLTHCDSFLLSALEKVQARPASGSGPVEVALPGPVFDLSSLVLFGAQAVPVQLKILLDRLYSVLPPEQVRRRLHGSAAVGRCRPGFIGLFCLSGGSDSEQSGLEFE